MSIYAIACPEARADDERIAAFRHWLRTEAEAEGVVPIHRPHAAE